MIETLKAGIAFPPKTLKNGRKLVFIFRVDSQIIVAVLFIGKLLPGVQNAIANFQFVQKPKQAAQEIG